MKDIKLTIEDIKKIFECFEVEGYKLRNHIIITPSKLQVEASMLKDETAMAYPLFLQRVIEGINEDIKFRIKQEGNILDVHLCDDFGEIKSVKQIGGYICDEAKESTIKYILDKLK